MKTKLLLLALGLSLVANAYLVLRTTTSRDAATVLAAEDRSAAAARAARPNGGATGASAAGPTTADGLPAVRWRNAKTKEELKALVDEMRAAGFPPELIRYALFRLTSTGDAARTEFAKLPFWHQNYNSKAWREAREKLSRENTALADSLLGPEERSAPPSFYQSGRYGNLPTEKIAQLEKIERDYGEVYWQQRRGADGLDALESFEGRQRIRLLEEEKEKDLATVLTPDELRDYQRRGSRGARTVIQGVADLEISEAEFDALYALQSSYLDSLPREASAAELTAALHENAAPAEQVRAILGDERFASYMAKVDPVFAQTAQFAKGRSEFSPDRVYQLYQLQSAALLAVSQTGRGRKPEELALTPAGRAALAQYQTQLDALLGADLAAAYRKTAFGRLFSPTP